MKGTLTAELHGETRRCGVESISEDTLGLTVAAIAVILRKALTSRVWSHGAIVLRDGKGEVLHTMAAKE